MSSANGTIGEIIKALDMAGVEMLAISLPDAFVIDATQCLVRRWGCSKYDMIGRQLSQSPDSTLQARYIDADLTGLGAQAATRVEVTYRASGASARLRRFKPQLFRDGRREYLLLVAEPQEAAAPRTDSARELGVERAATAGGYGLWDYDFRTRAGSTAPALLRLLGVERMGHEVGFLDLDSRAHPDDAARTASARLRDLSSSASGLTTRYRLRQEQGSYVWLEVLAGLVRDPIGGSVQTVFGLARDVTAEMEARDRVEASERSLARSQAVARMGSWALDLASGRMTVWSDHMSAMLGLDRPFQPGLDTLRRLVDPAHLDRWDAAIRSAADGQAVLGLECDFRHASGRLVRLNTHIDPEFAPDGGVIRLHGVCHDTSERVLIEHRLRQARRMETVGRLAADVAQDFDTLLRELLSNLEIAQQVTVQGDVASRISLAVAAARQGAEMSRRILDLAREEALDHDDAAALSPAGPADAQPELPLGPAPRADAEAAQAPGGPEAAPEPDEASAPRPVVLIVEDNDSVRAVAVAMVEELNCEVLDASNGLDALMILQERDDITLLLSDIIMAGMTGPELARQALEIRPDIKILFASGYAGETLDDLQDHPQFVDLIYKPFTREELSEKIRGAIGTRAA